MVNNMLKLLLAQIYLGSEFPVLNGPPLALATVRDQRGFNRSKAASGASHFVWSPKD